MTSELVTKAESDEYHLTDSDSFETVSYYTPCTRGGADASDVPSHPDSSSCRVGRADAAGF